MRAKYVAMTVCAALMLAGCGGSTDRAPFYSAIHRYVQGFRTYNVAEACGAMSPTFYRALAETIVDQSPTASLGSALRGDCGSGLGAYFRAARKARAGAPTAPSVTLVGLRVRGATATATGVHGGSREPFRFLRTGGNWRLACCVGAQLDGQPSVSYRVPSQSMEPTLDVGQVVTADNTAFRTRPPALGEIVVLHPPAGADAEPAVCGDPDEGTGHAEPCGLPTARESAQTFLKRIVGRPGDRIAIVNGLVIRNGVSEGSAHTTPCGSDPEICSFPTAIVVPAGEYYVLGDNRGVSDDSRFWGPVKRAWIIGLVTRY
jgi:signal peptidase I